MLRLTLNTHLDLMMLRLAGRGTSFQVCMPMSDENSASAAFSQRCLFGERNNCFQVRGVSRDASSSGRVTSFAAPAQLPSLSGGLEVRCDRRVGAVGGLVIFGLDVFLPAGFDTGRERVGAGVEDGKDGKISREGDRVDDDGGCSEVPGSEEDCIFEEVCVEVIGSEEDWMAWR